MRLQEMDLNGWGEFGNAPASFTVKKFHLPRAWNYIYTTSKILLRIAHNGCGYAQVNPPQGILLHKQERYEKFPPFFVWIQEEGKPAFSNFFAPNTFNDINKEPDLYKCEFKPDGAEYLCVMGQWEVSTRLTISSDSPSIIMRIKVKNNGAAGKLRLCPVWRPHNTEASLAPWDIPELYQTSRFFNSETPGVLVETRDPGGNPAARKYTIMTTDLEIEGAEVCYEHFAGKGDFTNPEALCRKNWSISAKESHPIEKPEDEVSAIAKLPVAAMTSPLTLLEKGNAIEFAVTLHNIENPLPLNLKEEAGKAASLLSIEKCNASIQNRKDFFSDWNSRFRVETEDEAFNEYVNEWLPLQLYWVGMLDRGWPTGMRGTRDAAQDYSGITYLEPERGRKMLMEIFSCQRKDGYFPRQFSTSGPEGKHDLRPYIDSGCWVIELLYDCLRFSGDTNFLQKKTRWLDSKEESSASDHAKQAIEYLLSCENTGEHGLVKIWGGDWNDALNNAGLQGKGESVMTSCHLVYLLSLAQEIFSDDKELCERYREKAETLKSNIRKNALNKEGYLNGIYTDNDEWIFSDSDPDGEKRMNSPVNSFGIIAGIFNKEELPKLWDNIKSLKGPNGYRLFYPPLGKKAITFAGRMGTGDLVAGAAENGAVYNHGSQGFLARALASIGEGDKAFEVLRHIFPYDQNLHPTAVCKTEPYGILNCWSETPGREGEGERAFLSGTISTAFRVIYGEILGFKPKLNGILFEPCLPSAWKNLSYTCRFKSHTLKVRIERDDHCKSPEIEVNGKLEKFFIREDILKKNEPNEIKIVTG